MSNRYGDDDGEDGLIDEDPSDAGEHIHGYVPARVNANPSEPPGQLPRKKPGRKPGQKYPQKPKPEPAPPPRPAIAGQCPGCGQAASLSLDLVRELVRSARDRALSLGEQGGPVVTADMFYLAARFDGYCSLLCWKKAQPPP